MMSQENGKKTVFKIVVNTVKSEILFWTHSHVRNGLQSETSICCKQPPKLTKITGFQVRNLYAPVSFAQDFFQQVQAI